MWWGGVWNGSLNQEQLDHARDHRTRRWINPLVTSTKFRPATVAIESRIGIYDRFYSMPVPGYLAKESHSSYFNSVHDFERMVKFRLLWNIPWNQCEIKNNYHSSLPKYSIMDHHALSLRSLKGIFWLIQFNSNWLDGSRFKFKLIQFSLISFSFVPFSLISLQLCLAVHYVQLFSIQFNYV